VSSCCGTKWQCTADGPVAVEADAYGWYDPPAGGRGVWYGSYAEAVEECPLPPLEVVGLCSDSCVSGVDTCATPWVLPSNGIVYSFVNKTGAAVGLPNSLFVPRTEADVSPRCAVGSCVNVGPRYKSAAPTTFTSPAGAGTISGAFSSCVDCVFGTNGFADLECNLTLGGLIVAPGGSTASFSLTGGGDWAPTTYARRTFACGQTFPTMQFVGTLSFIGTTGSADVYMSFT
jgi:hypothetical protein